MVARRQCTPKTSRYQSISLVFFSPIFSLPFLRKSILLLFFHPFFLFLFSDSATASLKLFARQWRGRNAGWNRVRSVSKSFRRWENKVIAPRCSNVVDTSILVFSGIKLIRALFSADIFLPSNIFRFARTCPVRDARWSRETSVSRWVFNIVKVETKNKTQILKSENKNVNKK